MVRDWETPVFGGKLKASHGRIASIYGAEARTSGKRSRALPRRQERALQVGSIGIRAMLSQAIGAPAFSAA